MTEPAAHRKIGAHFRRGMANYAAAADVQAQIAVGLADAIAAAAPQQGYRQGLEFGCGTGFLTRALQDRLCSTNWLINDLLPEARAQVAPLFAGHTAWEFQHGPVESLNLSRGFDLIAAASAVQWVRDVPALLARLSAALMPGGVLALSSFAPGHFAELQALVPAISTMSYHSAQEWQAMLATLDLLEIRSETCVQRFASPRDVLLHLRRTGVNATAKLPWSRGHLAAFEQAYRQQFPDGRGGVTLTYAPVRVLARQR